jgi:hypothetical protein
MTIRKELSVRRQPMETRRQLMGIAALALAGCGGESKRRASAGSQRDADVLRRLLGVERRTVAAYAAASRLLPAEARGFLAHERDHALGLEQAIRDLGGAVAAAGASAATPRLRDRTSALEHLLALEDESAAAYLGALPQLSSPDLRATVAATLTTEAEHSAVLLDALGRAPVPAALFGGSG